MAETTTELERVYTIPLRRAKHGTRSKRADRAVRDVRAFLQRHMKCEDIWIDGEVNERIWQQGKFSIPSRIRVRATRFSDGVVEVALPESESAGSLREAIQERLEKAAESPVLAPREEEEEGEEEESLEDERPVTVVTGIGPATATKLEAAGIASVGALASTTASEVAKALGGSDDAAQGWIDKAREAVESARDAEVPPDETPEEGDSEEAPQDVAADSEEE